MTTSGNFQNLNKYEMPVIITAISYFYEDHYNRQCEY